MTQSVATHKSGDYHQPSSAVERRHHLRVQIHTLFVSLTGADKRSRQLHKDLQQGKIKLADNVAALIDAGLTNREESKIRAIANALFAWCSAGKARCSRKFSQIFCAETHNQGELDNVELAIEQGDRSPQMLDRLIHGLDNNMATELEMKEWALHERYIAGVGR